MTAVGRLKPWPFVGRDCEVDVFLNSLKDRHTHGFVVYGPAGVGKSRLAEECLAQAVRDGFKGLRVTANATAGVVPLGAVAHLIPDGVDLSDPVRGFAVVADTLTRESRRCPWVVWVDDLHLLDASSAVLLKQLMDAGVIRLIATVRSGYEVGQAVGMLCHGDSVRRIDLAELRRRETEHLLQVALGGPVGRRTLRYLHEGSGGNVLYLHELVVGAASSEALVYDGEVWELAAASLHGPPSLLELVKARLAGTGPAASPVLELLALCAPLPLIDAEAFAALGVLAGLEQTGLVQTERDQRRATVAFTHPLFGEVVRESIPSERRLAIFREQAERTEAYSTRRREDPHRIAIWRLAATEMSEPAHLMQAANLAHYAHDFPQAVALLRILPADQQTLGSRLLLGSSLFETGNAKESENILVEASRLARTESDKLAVTFTRTMSLFWAGHTTKAMAVNEISRQEVTGADAQRMLRINEAAMLTVSGNPLQGLAAFQELGDAPSPAAHTSLWLYGAVMKPAALAVTGHTHEAVAAAEHAYALYSSLADRTLLLHPASLLVSLVLALAEAGRLDEAREAAQRAWGTLGQVRNPLSWIWLAYHQAHAERLAGHIKTARRWYAEAAAHSRTHHISRGLPLILSGLAACAAQLGDIKAAVAIKNEASIYPPTGYRSGEERIGEAWLHVALGELDKAQETLTQAAEAARVGGYVTSEVHLLAERARIGNPQSVVPRLTELTGVCDGAWPSVYLRLATALSSRNPDVLLGLSKEMGEHGADLLAAEAAATASHVLQQTGKSRRSTAANQVTRIYAARCEGAQTSLLPSIDPDTSPVLTAREREIAALAASGEASKEIAQRFHLSVRTVDNHLHHAYTKLGVTTRNELADALKVIEGRVDP
ncbi:LuxR C-terminal-related transcriptional regulator [Streptomyces sp. NPDC056069]|uniref:LuxR C-terminal-related transcriptional regulator n=1 Tax=Streptomyces sp. NPDC056069 TaxID=3345702 RepID=UPI0035E2B507